MSWIVYAEFACVVLFIVSLLGMGIVSTFKETQGVLDEQKGEIETDDDIQRRAW